MNGPDPSTAYRIAFVDLDDTLLGPHKEVSPENRRALDRLRALGVQIAIASGRHHFNIAGMEAVQPVEWILSSHGSVIRHAGTNEVLAEMSVEAAVIQNLSARARSLDFTPFAYHRDGVYVEQENDWTDLYARNAGWKPTVGCFDDLDPAGFQKLLWSGRPERVEELILGLMSEFEGRLSVMETNPELIEFFSPTANKAIGAEILTRHLQIEPGQVLAFGDGNNDVEILGWAGMSVAMAHGRERARQAARFISPPGPPESAFARAVDLALTFSHLGRP